MITLIIEVVIITQITMRSNNKNNDKTNTNDNMC